MQKNIPLDELKSRKEKLENLLLDNSIFILFSNKVLSRNGDVEYNFRQDSNFWYLTGIDQQQSALIIAKRNGKLSSTLFIKEKSEIESAWTGKSHSFDQSQSISGVDKVSKIEDFFSALETEFKDVRKAYFSFKSSFVNQIIEIAGNQKIPPELAEVNNLLKQLRIRKSSWELEQLRQAAQINTLAFNKVQGILSDWYQTKTNQAEPFLTPLEKVELFEYQVEAEILNVYKQNGLEWSYTPIVAGGNNATILHYTKNNQILHKGDLLLIDAGCEYNYYASDVTRTFMLGGQPNTFQQEIYNLVLKANQEVIETARAAFTPSELGITEKISMQGLHEIAVKTLTQGLVDLNILMEGYDSAIEKESHKKFFKGHSHWLGLDVHDLGFYKDIEGKETMIEPGMVFTVEPGLYFDPEDDAIPPELRGIGVRIEDDIAVTEQGIQILTEGIEK